MTQRLTFLAQRKRCSEYNSFKTNLVLSILSWPYMTKGRVLAFSQKLFLLGRNRVLKSTSYGVANQVCWSWKKCKLFSEFYSGWMKLRFGGFGDKLGTSFQRGKRRLWGGRTAKERCSFFVAVHFDRVGINPCPTPLKSAQKLFFKWVFLALNSRFNSSFSDKKLRFKWN